MVLGATIASLNQRIVAESIPETLTITPENPVLSPDIVHRTLLYIQNPTLSTDRLTVRHELYRQALLRLETGRRDRLWSCTH